MTTTSRAPSENGEDAVVWNIQVRGLSQSGGGEDSSKVQLRHDELHMDATNTSELETLRLRGSELSMSGVG